MRTYWENGDSFTEFLWGGVNEPVLTAESVLSGIGYARIPVPGYEGAALSTWKDRHFKRIRIKDDSATNTLWEGYIDEVKPSRNGVELVCLEPQAKLMREIAESWADYRFDHGILENIATVYGSDYKKAWATNVHQNRGLVILGMPNVAEVRKIDIKQDTVRIGFKGFPYSDYGPSVTDTNEAISYTYGYEVEYNTEATEEHRFLFEGDTADLSKIIVKYKLRIDWTGTNPGAKFQVWNGSGWDDIVSSFTDYDWEKGTHEITSSIANYVDSDGIFKVRIYTTGVSLDYKWFISEISASGEYTSEYDGDVVSITANDATSLTCAQNLATLHIPQGARYGIAERNDVMIEDIFTNETTLFDYYDVDTSSHYTYRSFENSPCLEIVKACMDRDNAEFWNDLTGSGFEFRYATSFADSGITITEAHIEPDGFLGGYASDTIVKKVFCFGAPERQLSHVEEAGDFSAGDPHRLFSWATVQSITELMQKAKAILTNRGSAHYRGGFKIGVDTSAFQQLTVGQTVDLSIDMDDDASPEISENNVLVRKITREQSPNGALRTTLEVGATPLFVRAAEGRPSDSPQLDAGWEKRRHLPDPAQYGVIEQTARATLPSTDPTGTLGGEREIPLSFDSTYSEIAIQRDQADKFWTSDASNCEIGTSTSDEDANFYGDIDGGTTATTDIIGPDITIRENFIESDKSQGMYVLPVDGYDVNIGDGTHTADVDGIQDGLFADDVDADDDVYVGTSALSLTENPTGDLRIDVTTAVRIYASSSDPRVEFREDSTYYGNIRYSKSNNRLEYYAYDSGGEASHAFNGTIQGDIGTDSDYNDIYCDTLFYVSLDETPWPDHLDDLQIIMDMTKTHEFPEIIKDETGTFIDSTKRDGLLFGAIRQLTTRIKELEEQVHEQQSERTTESD